MILSTNKKIFGWGCIALFLGCGQKVIPVDPVLPMATVQVGNIEPAEDRDTLLHRAILGRADVGYIKILLQTIDVNKTDNQSETALHLAAKQGNPKLVKMLLAHQANVHAKNLKGSTPLHLAALAGQLEVIQVLLSNKADIAAADNLGQTPLHFAAFIGQVPTVQLLISHQASLYQRDYKGRIPYDLAGSPIVKQLLIPYINLSKLIFQEHYDNIGIRILDYLTAKDRGNLRQTCTEMGWNLLKKEAFCLQITSDKLRYIHPTTHPRLYPHEVSHQDGSLTFNPIPADAIVRRMSDWTYISKKKRFLIKNVVFIGHTARTLKNLQQALPPHLIDRIIVSEKKLTSIEAKRVRGLRKRTRKAGHTPPPLGAQKAVEEEPTPMEQEVSSKNPWSVGLARPPKVKRFLTTYMNLIKLIFHGNYEKIGIRVLDYLPNKDRGNLRQTCTEMGWELLKQGAFCLQISLDKLPHIHPDTHPRLYPHEVSHQDSSLIFHPIPADAIVKRVSDWTRISKDERFLFKNVVFIGKTARTLDNLRKKLPPHLIDHVIVVEKGLTKEQLKRIRGLIKRPKKPFPTLPPLRAKPAVEEELTPIEQEAFAENPWSFDLAGRPKVKKLLRSHINLSKLIFHGNYDKIGIRVLDYLPNKDRGNLRQTCTEMGWELLQQGAFRLQIRSNKLKHICLFTYPRLYPHERNPQQDGSLTFHPIHADAIIQRVPDWALISKDKRFLIKNVVFIGKTACTFKNLQKVLPAHLIDHVIVPEKALSIRELKQIKRLAKRARKEPIPIDQEASSENPWSLSSEIHPQYLPKKKANSRQLSPQYFSGKNAGYSQVALQYFSGERADHTQVAPQYFSGERADHTQVVPQYFSGEGATPSQLGSPYFSREGANPSQLDSPYFPWERTTPSQLSSPYFSKESATPSPLGFPYFSREGATPSQLNSPYFPWERTTPSQLGSPYFPGERATPSQLDSPYFSREGATPSQLDSPYFPWERTTPSQLGSPYFSKESATPSPLGFPYFSREGATPSQLNSPYFPWESATPSQLDSPYFPG